MALLFVTFLGDETMYDRETAEKQPRKPSGWFKYRIHILSGYYGSKCKERKTIWRSMLDMLYLLTRPYFLLLCSTPSLTETNSVFYLLSFMWNVGINQSLILFLYPPPEAGGYGFSNLAAGLFYIAPMTAVVIGELFGHFFSILFNC
jgi:hypothetical protein